MVCNKRELADKYELDDKKAGGDDDIDVIKDTPKVNK